MLFLIIPFENLVNSNILYHPIFANVSFFGVGLQLIGIFLISSATLVAIGGRISRGKRAFSWGVPIVLEKNGMYRYLRHPLYASYFYYFVGFLFLLQNFLLIFLLLGIPGYYDMAVYEEEILVQEFGHEYIEYQKRTKMFIPFIW
jgi:protein-S-isoprenylcysteine O-methyltransferase